MAMVASRTRKHLSAWLLLRLCRDLCLEQDNDMFNALELIKLLLFGLPQHAGGIQRQQALEACLRVL